MARLTLSARIPSDLTPSSLHAALTDETALPATDLTQSNPTLCGFAYPTLALPLLGPQTWDYAPDALGSPVARRQLAEYLNAQPLADTQAQTHVLAPDDVVLTASTSEAFGTLLKLLCNPGDCIAIGVPGYPLVPHLAQLEAVSVCTYRWVETGGVWDLDWDSVRQCLQQNVRALIVVQPTSPMGASLGSEALGQLSALCADARVVLIIDAVFAAYTPEGAPGALPARMLTQAMTVVLGGLSKAAAMPQLKLGWMLLYGEAAQKAQMREALAWIQDAYLSISTPIQVALPDILPHLRPMQTQIQARIAQNYAALQVQLSDVPNLEVKPYHGGWYAVFEGPQDADEEHVTRLLHSAAQAMVHPGYFYDFEREGLWVVSLIVMPDAFAQALRRMALILRTGPWQAARELLA